MYIPENMFHNHLTPHVFAMHNLNWKIKKIEVGSFNATTAIIIENSGHETSTEEIIQIEGVSIPISTLCNMDTLITIPETVINVCYISAMDRQNSRKLSNIEGVFLIWRLGRYAAKPRLLQLPHEETLICLDFLHFVPGCYNTKRQAK